MSSYTFLIVGGSSGIGLSLAITALQAGHKVIATARNPAKARAASPDVEGLGGSWLALDVTDPETESIVRKTAETHKVNVLVNAAGYALLGAFEDFSDTEMLAQLDTNFHGCLRTMQGVIPVFREQNGGTILNVSSGAGITGLPSRGLYAASKFALEGVSEALSQELAPFNIRIVIADLGMFRTNFFNTVATPAKGMSKHYEGTPAQEVLKMTQNMSAAPRMNSADKAAERMLEMITGTGMCKDKEIQGCLRLVLGEDCTKRIRQKLDELTRNTDIMESIAASTLEDEK